MIHGLYSKSNYPFGMERLARRSATRYPCFGGDPRARVARVRQTRDRVRVVQLEHLSFCRIMNVVRLARTIANLGR
ncbi:MAG: hypothetical protein QOF35_1859 [Actinomycetota bacterium]|jgi:hypothetical protein|nr:hypothetical protein [Actinomycetota bacterium]